MSLRIINSRWGTKYKRGSYVHVKDKGVGKITKSDYRGYLYVKIKGETIKTHPSYVTLWDGFVGAEYEI